MKSKDNLPASYLKDHQNDYNLNEHNDAFTRRSFLNSIGLGAVALGLGQFGCSTQNKSASQVPDMSHIQGFDETVDEKDASKGWHPLSERKIRVGIVGYGYSKFGGAFDFHNHPNVEVVAVSDLFPDRCAALAKVNNCNKTYPSFEELLKDDTIEAVFIATDAPSHGRHTLEALKHGKHVAVAVPAAFGSLEEADKVFEAVKESGLKYMMFETSSFRKDTYAMRQIYLAGGFGNLIYTEGEYFHPRRKDASGKLTQNPSFKNWRYGLPPQWYPTHSNAYYIGVTDGSFTEVSCMGMPSSIDFYQPDNNRYKNPFGTEIALFRTSEGGMARMGVSWDTPGDHGERGRIRGEKGTYYEKYSGYVSKLPDCNRPPLPPGMPLGGHGGSHGYLTNEFISSILLDRKPLIDVATALNMTVSGIVAHQSALNDGELLKIPQYKLTTV
jgi:predicted dehydrogenase